MDKLCELNFDVSLETSGDKSCKQVNSKVFKIIDIKTPDSGEVNSFNFDNLNLLDENYEYKFVIGSDKDFLWSLNFIKEFKLAEDKVLMSPSFNIYSQKSLAEKILSEKINVRFQTQLHKSIWPDCESGV
jgi:7-carboxy-7-deazaguanine synthase